MLADSPAKIVQRLLVDLGQAGDPGLWATGQGPPWPVFATNEPNLPDDCVTVYDTQAKDFGRSQVDGKLFQHYGVQARVRSVDHPSGWTKASALRVALAEGLLERVVTVGANSYLVRSASSIGQVIVLGKDTPTSKRSLFTLNFNIVVRDD